MPLIGTAGHVDHGKSTLIQALTGRDPDRWREEKERGLTIDLGFAWATLADGRTVSFVDVPGHERFLKNMLAGIEAIDVALMVVSAEEGWMPQSEEHLAVLDLLDVSRGVVALTKVDLVDDDLVDLAGAEVVENLAGTSLEGARVIPVSATTGHGIDDLTSALAAQLPEEIDDRMRPRLWVDRSFAAAGAGTVVTGTLLGGSLAVGDELEAWPQGITVRVRGLQSHEAAVHEVAPGRRVAVNVAGLDHHQIGRGDMLGLPGHWLLTDRATARFRHVRYVEGLDVKGDYQVHIGSAARHSRLAGIEDGIVLLHLDQPLPLATGDRLIIRDTGRKLVTAGGAILDPAPSQRTRHALEASAHIDPFAAPNVIAQALLEVRGASPLYLLESHSGGGQPANGRVIAGNAMTESHFTALTTRAEAMVRSYHERQPLRPGIPFATLAEGLGVEPPIAEAVVDETNSLRRIGPDVAIEGHQTKLSPQQSQAWEEARSRLEAGLDVPREEELGIDLEVVHLKIRAGELIRVAQGLLYLPDQVDRLREAILAMDEAFTVSQFRDSTGLSRKYAVPILEWSDREGLTIRRGDLRSVR